ncbi:acetyl-CoA carboxylase [Rhizobium sp. CFBP 8762]|uniref:acetyl-CoA carboxylase n=1 Tax=Rhizobium sp. CFBP 8762 TaxID=2775279 RepID=UPI00177F6D97|nr:acetyl-CoA carboxylase [Rhizobium sp. CFBP 8762]MBD8554496.1 acetyl-CoA carboxylase [Rhizobium sp. CFBP 8762]
MSKMDLSAPATIETLTAALEAAGVDGLEITRPGQSLRIVISGTAPAHTVSVSDTFQAKIVKAPMAGQFLCDLPAVPGCQTRKRPADTLGFLRVGPMLLPVKTETAACVHRYLVDHETIVGFGDPIAEITSQ